MLAQLGYLEKLQLAEALLVIMVSNAIAPPVNSTQRCTMPALWSKRVLTSQGLLAAFFALFVFTAAAMSMPAVSGLLPGLGLAAMAVVGVLAYRVLLNRAREAEQALAEGERYIEAVAELSQDIHAIIAARSRNFLYLNPAVTTLLGHPQESFTRGGMVFFGSLVHPDDLAGIQAKYDEVLRCRREPGAKEDTQEQVFRLRDYQGNYRWFRCRMTVFVRFNSGQPAELLAVIQDVTEQRRYEAALLEAQKHESLGALARGTMHDLNNTLMGIQGFTEIALEGNGSLEVLRHSLENVQTSMVRASALCRQMVAYAGTSRIQIASRQLNDAVRDSLPALESMIPQGCQLELDLEEDLPMASADLNQARYALLNLVYNAAEAVRSSGGEISIRTRVKHLTDAVAGLEGAYVCLEVRDTGPGLPAELLEERFDPLFSTKWPGHGLGLSAVQRIMGEHQGAVRTVGGQGDITQLYFPLAGRTPALDAGDEGTPVAGLAGMILLVDDEPTIRAILRQGLEIAGFKVLEAEDGVDGFGAFVRHRSSISLVLLDLTMPRMGGDEVFEEIHKLDPDLPVVLMSGYSEGEATSAMSCKGLAGFLSKPCSIKDALAVVRRALGMEEP
jgi:PAS domain S-box-containing protein